VSDTRTSASTAPLSHEAQEKNYISSDGGTAFASSSSSAEQVVEDMECMFEGLENWDSSAYIGSISHEELGKNNSSRSDGGTGYAGTPNDTRIVAENLKLAQARAQNYDAQRIAYLNNMEKDLKKREDWDVMQCFLGSERQNKLQETLVEVLRESSVTEWEERFPVLMAALRLCHLLASDIQLASAFFSSTHSYSAKNRSSCSLLSSIDELAEQARLILHESHKRENSPLPYVELNSSDIAVATFLLQVQDEANKALSQLVDHEGSPNTSSLQFQSPLLQFSSVASSSLSSPAKIYHHSLEDEYWRRLGNFRLDFVDDLPNHAFEAKGLFSGKERNTVWVGGDNRHLYKELVSYKTSLPIECGSSIFVRVKSSQIHLVRALITGAEGTPYANGCFVFDIFLPYDYPNVCPEVRFCTTGNGHVRFNPNLYNDGQVCLSLLGTWHGPGWIANQSTLLQVLLSIQSMIFVPDPYFNEPAWDINRGTPQGRQSSENYNTKIREYTWKYAILEPLQQSLHVCTTTTNNVAKENMRTSSNSFSNCPEFMQVITEHFRCKSQVVRDQIESWFSISNQQEQQKLFTLKSGLGLKRNHKGDDAATEENISSSSSCVNDLTLLLEQL
jgi:ubiquitin-protein ligase